MLVIVQIVGALLVLLPFTAQQLGKLRADAPAYLWPNLIGSALLAVLAIIGAQWGFLLLEGAWAGVSARALLARGLLRAGA
jgi:protein-S-isoprenylcysteine O-methyltransferase Ste14